MQAALHRNLLARATDRLREPLDVSGLDLVKAHLGDRPSRNETPPPLPIVIHGPMLAGRRPALAILAQRKNRVGLQLALGGQGKRLLGELAREVGR